MTAAEATLPTECTRSDRIANPDRIPPQHIGVTVSTKLNSIEFSLTILILCSLLSLPKVLMNWEDGLYGINQVNKNLPVWDYVNLWTGGKMVEESRTRDIFSQEKFSGWQREKFGSRLERHEWSYPPTLLLLAVPLSKISLGWSFAIYLVGSTLFLALVMYSLGAGPLRALLAVASPAAIINAGFGQNGAWTAALLIGGIGWSTRRPLIAGVLLGLLSLKPHLGLLVPVCLLASRNWKALASCALTSIALVLLSAYGFGWEAWALFISETRPLMQSILEAPWMHPYQVNAISVFHLARSLGGDLTTSYLCQSVSTALAVGVVWRLWRNPAADQRFRVAMTIFLTYLATPYGWTYDLVAVCAVIAWVAPFEARRKSDVFMLIVWAISSASAVIVINLKLPLAAVFLALWIIAYSLRQGAQSKTGAA